MLEKLDTLDKQILYWLDHQGDISYSELARKVKRGRDIVEYRVKRLIEKNIINGFRAVINPAPLGMTLYKTYLRLANQQKQLQTFIKKLKSEKRVFWIVECSGQWDLIFSIAATSAYEFHSIQGRLLNDISNILIASQVYVVVSFKIFRLKYLFSSGTHCFEIGGKPQNLSIDSEDLKLIDSLCSNARLSMQELASNLKISPTTALSRLNNLKKNGIIKGHEAVIDLESLGIVQFKTQLFFNDFNQEEEQRLEKYCSQHPLITSYILQIGDCRSEIELHVENYMQYTNAIDELRQNFPLLIKNTNTILMHRQYLNWCASCTL